MELAPRIRALLKQRGKVDTEIAALLRKHLDKVGEQKWLAWCEKEFGWARTSAYRHLNPELLEKAKRAQAARRANVPTLEHAPADDAPEESKPTPNNDRASFLIHADAAWRFATMDYNIRADKEVLDFARRAADSWAALVQKMEQKPNLKLVKEAS